MFDFDDFSYGDDSSYETEKARPLSVAAFLRRVKSEFARHWGNVRLEGEIQAVKRYPSGHVYFDLKDEKEEALVDCVLFRRDAARLSFAPKSGDKVEVLGGLNVYEPRGQMNFIVREMLPAGAGALYVRFLALKEKLAAEGIFDESVKKAIPERPRTVGVVTSTEAAALRDVVRTLRKNAPWVEIVLYPCAVQGAGAESEILSALERADARHEVDVLLLVRGGGSLADLWNFNSEAIARRLRRMHMPVITGVGHETDFTIADFASDLRAATPTAAATAAVRGWDQVAERLSTAQKRLSLVVRNTTRLCAARLRQVDRLHFAAKANFKHAQMRLAAVSDLTRIFENRLDEWMQHVDLVGEQLSDAARTIVRDKDSSLQIVSERLHAQKPEIGHKAERVFRMAETLKRLMAGDLALKRERVLGMSRQIKNLDVGSVLRRGYSIAKDESGRVIRDAALLTEGQTLTVHFAKGSTQTEVKELRGK